jgi:threonine synthase
MLVCTRCNKKYPEDKVRYLCDCGGILEVQFKIRKPKMAGMGLQKYKEVLPIKRQLVTLGEGGTPLYRAGNLSNILGIDNLYLKFEGMNPTGSFKDRGSSVAITKALEFGYRTTVVASTGNMAASVSAYSAKANLNCSVYVPDSTPDAKLAQVIAYNGRLMKIRGTFKDCVTKAKLEAHSGSYLAMTGLNPYYIEGEKTLGYELAPIKPDYVFLPLGTGGLFTAVWKASTEQKKKTKMVGVQAEGCSPIVDAFEEGHEWPDHIENARTIASAILVKTPFNGHTAIRAMRASKGFGLKVDDFGIIDAIKLLGKEGVFAEPAAALPLSGLIKAWDQELISRDDTIVLVITGHGLKDPGALIGH